VATFLDTNQTDASELKLLWLLFPTWAEELSFLHRIQSKKHNRLSGVSFNEGKYAGFRICSFVVGVGSEAQQFCLQLSKLILENQKVRPNLVLLAGFAGGCKKESKTGDVFFVNCILDNHVTTIISETISVDPLFLNQNLIRFGVGVTVDRVATPEVKTILGKKGADLVEMEFKLVHDIFFEIRVPVFCLRVILDDLGFTIPEKLTTFVQKGRLLVLPLVFYLFFNPTSVLQLFLLGFKTSLAKKKLLLALLLLINGLGPKNRKNNEGTNFDPYI
jgi:nucleoside phosphorylase